MKLRPVLAQLLPPIVVNGMIAVRSRRAAPTHVLVDEWPEEIGDGSWNDPAVSEHYAASAKSFLQTINSAGPLGLGGCSSPAWSDYSLQLKYVTFGYVLALAARHRDRISLLDFGGNLGQYGAVAERLLTGVVVEYHCRDVPMLCSVGQSIFPQATFHVDNEAFAQQSFDVVMASGALQYVRDWRQTLSQLCQVCGDWLYVTRLPIFDESNSIVALQRVQFAGREHRSYVWCYNRSEFSQTVAQHGMQLIQEFLVQETMDVVGVKERVQMRGFLFRREQSVTP